MFSESMPVHLNLFHYPYLFLLIDEGIDGTRVSFFLMHSSFFCDSDVFYSTSGNLLGVFSFLTLTKEKGVP